MAELPQTPCGSPWASLDLPWSLLGLPLGISWAPLALFGFPLLPSGLSWASLGFFSGAPWRLLGSIWYLWGFIGVLVGRHLGGIWGPIWVIVDSISAFFWDHFDTILVQFGNRFRAILDLASFLVPFWVPV